MSVQRAHYKKYVYVSDCTPQRSAETDVGTCRKLNPQSYLF